MSYGVMMLLAIDIGNTHTVLGLFNGDELSYSWRFQSNIDRTVDEFGMQVIAALSNVNVNRSDISFCIIGSVVPALSRVFTKLVDKYFHVKSLLIDTSCFVGIDIRVEDTNAVGADRIANALGALERVGAPCIIVDFGTATTFDVVAPDGAFEGGIIAPGLLVSARALFEHTAKLPHIELAEPTHVVGKNTSDAMLSGIMFGYVELVDGLVRRIKRDGGDGAYSNAKVVSTGGMSPMISHLSSEIECNVPDLTLRGLLAIGRRNGYGAL